ncbi:HET-domain-containing protein [Hyaloscypha variabilis F]|uniref:HET-domain-containing protein n=1 Tax=Hyaloscypha variabilis (strain UAMH 11265 / GT02V1 / F) TaxID=1149755 RepID=A0A2J6RWH5_HYAVF|nr:HET-domain-containing protein [Hyaloscypha variabilis F]
MFCVKCQDILNLDVLLSTFEEDEDHYDEAKRHSHHESFTALEQSAKDGCELCRMACSSLPKPWGSKSVERRIWFQLRPGDFLMFGSDFLGHRGVAEPPSDKFGIRLSADQDSPLTTLKDGVFISRPPMADASSSSAFEMARYWLKTCLSTHPRCSLKESLLPTRVLDLGDRHDTRLSLRRSTGEHGQWLTLSHCWGSSNTAITTTSNFKARCNEIQIANLPATFRDAVKITRELGYRYLWIDSLCIIQDSVSDWQMESVKMAEIYANAVLNISTDASGGADEGIFESANRGEI